MTMEQNNIEFVKDLYAAFTRGDLPYILERFAPELEAFGVAATAERRAPWHFPGSCRQDVAKYFEALIGTLEPLGLEPKHFAASGDYVYVTLDQQWRVRKTGKLLPFKDGFHRFKLNQGKVVAWLASEDTELTMEALA
ncbi:MAG TPA: nuclear transport factor 2 family protein [Polyangiaceae bacterium]|nr:nuclear transport factor 2 family protein [Polyangiaceae bacterium]